MSWKPLLWSVVLAFVWTGAALWAVRPASPTMRYFVIQFNSDEYHVQAHEARIEGFCTVFLRDSTRVVGICGQHTWSEEVETR